MRVSYSHLYEAYDAYVAALEAERLSHSNIPDDPVRAFLAKQNQTSATVDGFQRMQKCREALDIMDRTGWLRSYHQRVFHDHFIRACSRVFFKSDPPGTFARAHQVLLELNSWDNLSQEVLISTPRRFGKTIAVSMFAAAMIYSAAQVELSIYSTCKRISQKLLRNVCKFLNLIYEAGQKTPMHVIRSNMEELVVLGPEGSQDIRVVNSYPSKVTPSEQSESCDAGVTIMHGPTHRRFTYSSLESLEATSPLSLIGILFCSQNSSNSSFMDLVGVDMIAHETKFSLIDTHRQSHNMCRSKCNSLSYRLRTHACIAVL